MFHKTCLSEKDLVLDMLADSGEIVRAVAKSARKPGNTFSNRLDLFNMAHVCIARTKSIDIIREAVLTEHFDAFRQDVNIFAGASAVSEILWRLTFDGEANPVMFEFIKKTFHAMSNAPQKSKVITMAACFKLLSLEGFRPQLKKCAGCEKQVNLNTDYVMFSPQEGGVLCNECEGGDFDLRVSARTIELINWLINSTYETILNESDVIGKRVYEMGKVLKKWTQYHVNCNLKSLHMALH